ncbi:MAG: type II toxin-antitoxin system VapC family toxin [Nitrospirales bacterium]|nr:type II toxin-antitoxin system VapC family toxin [Nitrospira sp.]MDR4501655.1 type II toxin-antitoxin system VapC family toxin [Nitrospirales bacterium]
MTQRILVDTDVLIDYFRGIDVACDCIEAHLDLVSLSVISVAEIRAGIRGKGEGDALEQFLSVIPIFDVTRVIAEKAGDWVNQFGKSHAVEIPDALIAATATVHDLQLKTLNIKHYPMFKGLVPAYKKR